MSSEAIDDVVEAKAEAPRVSVKERAVACGYLPMMLRGAGLNGAGTVNPQYWKLAAALARSGWTLDTQVTEREFADSVDAATNVQMR